MLKLLAHGGVKLGFIDHHVLEPFTERLGRPHRKMRDMAPDIHVNGFPRVRVGFQKTDGPIDHRRITTALGPVFCIPTFITINNINTISAILCFRPDVPFAKMPSAVSILIEQLRDGHPIPKTVIRHVLGKGRGKLAGHHTRAARATGHTCDIGLGKPGSLFGQLIQCWCLRIRMTIATEITVAQVISENENDVGLLCRVCTHDKEAHKNEGNFPNHAAAALSAFRMSALVFSDPSIGSMPPPSNSIEMTPE